MEGHRVAPPEKQSTQAPVGAVSRLFADVWRPRHEISRPGCGYGRDRFGSLEVDINGPCGPGLKNPLTKSRRHDAAAVRDRAVLLQSTSSYADLRSRFPELQRTLDESAADGSNGFAENLLVRGIGIDDVCIGDLWCTPSGVQLQVCTPRQPCGKLDRAHSSRPVGRGRVSLMVDCLRTGSAGWFCRVLRGGKIHEGDSLRCIGRPHPQWTIRRTAEVVYGQSDNTFRIRLPRENKFAVLRDMHELADIEEFGNFEWRDPLLAFLKGVGAYTPSHQEQTRETVASCSMPGELMSNANHQPVLGAGHDGRSLAAADEFRETSEARDAPSSASRASGSSAVRRWTASASACGACATAVANSSGMGFDHSFMSSEDRAEAGTAGLEQRGAEIPFYPVIDSLPVQTHETRSRRWGKKSP